MSNDPHALQSDPHTSMQLITRAKAGDRIAMELLCSRYLKRLQTWAHGRLPAWARSHMDTQDIAQETLIQVIRRLEQFDPQHEAAFQAYVFRTMISRVLDEIRRSHRKPAGSPLDSDYASTDPSPHDLAAARQLRDRYEATLLRLNEPDRDAIIARVELDLSWPEVTQALEKPSVAAARMAVSRALVKLAREMSHEH